MSRETFLLESRYGFALPLHSKTAVARTWRNGRRLIYGVPPLIDRHAGFESTIAEAIGREKYSVAVVEHFWCAPYANVLRPAAGTLVLDLHNIESELAQSHARAARFPLDWAFRRFGAAYRQLERKWFPKFDIVLTASEADRKRVDHPNVHIYPNALPEIAPAVAREADAVVFSGNLEYHPNVEAVRWFRQAIWPRVRERLPTIEWRLIGRNPHAVERYTRGDPRLRVIGPVEDAVAALAEASVCVVPLISGSGTRFKILEAWAASRAVVSTSIGAEGLEARAGEHLLIADDAESFARAIVSLIESPGMRARLGQAGRKLYEERYTWQAAWRELEAAGLG